MTHHCLPPAPAPLPLKKPRCCPALRRRNAEKRSALYGFRLPGRRIRRFRGTAIHHPTQQHHTGNSQRRAEEEEIEPPHHFDKITCAGIDKGARHRRETGKQRKLGCGIAPVGCARNVGGKAAVPNPMVKYSSPCASAKPDSTGPARASHANPSVERICVIPNTHKPRAMPIRLNRTPPSKPPTTPVHKPEVLATMPIWVLLKPRSR